MNINELGQLIISLKSAKQPDIELIAFYEKMFYSLWDTINEKINAYLKDTSCKI